MIIKVIKFSKDNLSPAETTVLQASSVRYKDEIFKSEIEQVMFEIGGKDGQSEGIIHVFQKPCMIYIMENGKTVDTLNCCENYNNNK